MPDSNFVQHQYGILWVDFLDINHDIQVFLDGVVLHAVIIPKAGYNGFFHSWHMAIHLDKQTIEVPSQRIDISHEDALANKSPTFQTVTLKLPPTSFTTSNKELRDLGRELFGLYCAQHTTDYRQ